MIKTVIVENEQLQVDILTRMLAEHHPEIVVLAICPTILEAVEKINLHLPDLVFLDINLDDDGGGFQVLEFTKSVNYEVIFTTSYSDYAIRAIKFSALDFLLRPFGEDDLNEALKKYSNMRTNGSKRNIEALLHNVRQTDASMQKVGIPVLGGLDFITISEIILCKSENNCTDFHLTNKRRIMATKTLKWVDELMRDHHFFRVHDSYLINLNHIKKYKKGGEGGVVELTDQKEADVARRRKDDFLKALADLKMIAYR